MDFDEYFDLYRDPDPDSDSDPDPDSMLIPLIKEILWDPNNIITPEVLLTLWVLFRLRNSDARQKFPDVSTIYQYEHQLTPDFIRNYWRHYRQTLEPILTRFIEQKNAQLEFISNRENEPKYVIIKCGKKFLTSAPPSDMIEYDDVIRTLTRLNPELARSSHGYVIQLIPI